MLMPMLMLVLILAFMSGILALRHLSSSVQVQIRLCALLFTVNCMHRRNVAIKNEIPAKPNPRVA